MKRVTLFLALLLAFFAMTPNSRGQALDRDQLIRALKTLDTSIVGYFPRWKVCEYDLQIQIEQAFRLYGYPSEELDLNNILVTAAPKTASYEPFQLLLIECGTQRMVASEIDKRLETLASIISGEVFYSGPDKGFINDNSERTYCFVEIPKQTPLTQFQYEEITNYLQPTNVNHSISISVFDQSVKIGESGFWLRNTLGTDAIGYHFWSSGEAHVTLRRPLYENPDVKTRTAIPHLIDAYMGASYRLSTGLSDKGNSVFDFVADRKLNTGPGGKLLAGLDFHAPFHPQVGIHFNMSLPFTKLGTESVDADVYATLPVDELRREVDLPSKVTAPFYDVDSVTVPLLRSTGQLTVFYNWWLDPKRPENFFRFDAGISYAEVREAAFYIDENKVPFITTEGVIGLYTYKPGEFADWLFLKAEYRNQAAFPFGVSVQYSNQILLGRIYLPIFGKFLYLEGKYATPLRDVRPYESEHFFMISPVLRLTI